MIIGHTFFGYDHDGCVFDTNIPVGSVHYMELKNSKVDHIKIDEALVPYSNEKLDWDYDSIVVTDFVNSLEVSNVSDTNVPIKYLRVKKRKKDSLTWQDVEVFDFSKDIKNYQFEDLLVESLEDYEYALQPVAVNGIMGSEKIQTVETDYDGIWVVDKDMKQHQFNMGLNNNMELSEIQTVGQSTVLETLGGQFPIIASNNTNYRRFSVKAVLISNSENTANGQIDRKAEKKHRKMIEEFLKDGKPKIVKESDNVYVLGYIPRESVVVIPCNDLDRQIGEVEFEVIEIGNADDIEKLQDLGFIPDTFRVSGNQQR